jgi:hypothetical protein
METSMKTKDSPIGRAKCETDSHSGRPADQEGYAEADDNRRGQTISAFRLFDLFRTQLQDVLLAWPGGITRGAAQTKRDAQWIDLIIRR